MRLQLHSVCVVTLEVVKKCVWHRFQFGLKNLIVKEDSNQIFILQLLFTHASSLRIGVGCLSAGT